MSDIIADLRWRGLIHQTTEEESALARWLLERPRTLYAGFDPTADSLHVGSLLPLLLLRRFQKAGHRPIAVVGGATGMIGDPSGKSEERKLLSVEALRANVSGLESQMRRFLDFDASPIQAVLVNNYDWISRFGYIEFLRDIGKNFPVNVMLAKESVRARLDREDTGMSYTEFSYMLLQAYDFVYLNEHHGCELQIGGSDQWGNITAGIDLARRMRSVQLYGMTCPLLTKSDGGKMGKTESGTIWLSPARTSPYQFYQYWINVEDADAGKCLRFLTELSHDEIESLDVARTADPAKRDSQRRLAEELTRLVHGEAGLTAARKASDKLFRTTFGGRVKDQIGELISTKELFESERAELSGEEVQSFTDAELAEIFADVPSKELPRHLLYGDGFPLTKALLETYEFFESPLPRSNSQVRRWIQQGGVYINNRCVRSIDYLVTEKDLSSETMLVLRLGRKKYAIIRFV